jgi:hypothetical protein
MRTQLLATAFIVTIVLLGMFTALPALASNTTRRDELITRIAGKFHLNKSDVQDVFDAFRTERQGARETKYEAYLTGLVTKGTITEAQKSLLIAKRKEVLAKFADERNTRQSLTPEQRKARRKEVVNDLKSWSEQNHIDLKYLFHAGGNKMFRLGYRMDK